MLCLDLGCGTGTRYGFNPSCPLNAETILMDIDMFSREVVRLAESRASLHIVVGSGEHLPLRDSVLDRVYVLHVLEHLESPLRCLRELHRACRRGAVVHVAVPNFLSRNARGDPDHRHIYSIFRLYREAKRAGFRRFVFATRAGSRLPRLLRILLILCMNVVAEELRAVLVRED